MILALLIPIWLPCAIAAYGIEVAASDASSGMTYHQRCGFALAFALIVSTIGLFMAPVLLFIAWATNGCAQHGFRLWPRRDPSS